jgi:hypothetical protein
MNMIRIGILDTRTNQLLGKNKIFNMAKLSELTFGGDKKNCVRVRGAQELSASIVMKSPGNVQLYSLPPSTFLIFSVVFPRVQI